MIPIDQTIFGKPSGNCFQACIASIFELLIDEVPNFVAVPEDEDWWDGVEKFCMMYGYWPLMLDAQKMREINVIPKGYHIIGGKSPRGLLHSTVGCHGEIVHDPHPERTGLVEEIDFTVFVAILDDARKDN